NNNSKKMTSVGEYLKRERERNNFSIEELSKKTKIKRSYIEYIEDETWKKLPEFPVIQGFVKNISTNLGIKKEQAVALLRRDYPPKKLLINPKPDVSDKTRWNPKLAFTIGIIGVAVLVLGYLIYQYFSFNSPPKLVLERPGEGEKVLSSQLVVEGETNSDATLVANNQPILVDEEGSFLGEIEVFDGTTEVVVVARSRSGKEQIINRKINVDLGEEK
ncbi:helix-turn-helix domain-containing protein, partial [Candidatus Woesebacteria bacterium]|nr:helix-turn-helix domain-containing protein [Candidatus Woesebacteria bacterium]